MLVFVRGLSARVDVFVRGRAARAGCGSASRVLAPRVPLLGPVAFSVVTGPLAAGRGISTFPSLFMTRSFAVNGFAVQRPSISISRL